MAFYYTDLDAVYISDLEKWCSMSCEESILYPYYDSGADLYLNGELVTELVVTKEFIDNYNVLAFRGCTSLKTVTIADGVTAIPSYMFEECEGLENVTIASSVNSIGYGAFDGCSSLTSIVIPENVTRIDSWTFRGTSLSYIVLPASLRRIDTDAFTHSPLTVYYEGTAEQWASISINYQWNGNKPLQTATIHYNYKR